MFTPAAQAAPSTAGNTWSWCLIARSRANVMLLNLLTIFGQVLNKTRCRLPSFYMDLHFLENSEPVRALQKALLSLQEEGVRRWAQRIINQALLVRPTFT